MSAAPRAVLRVRVVPRASRSSLAREADGRLRVHLTAPPVEGAANRALIALLAERLDLPRSALELVRGEHSRDKLVCVHGSDGGRARFASGSLCWAATLTKGNGVASSERRILEVACLFTSITAANAATSRRCRR